MPLKEMAIWWEMFCSSGETVRKTVMPSSCSSKPEQQEVAIIVCVSTVSGSVESHCPAALLLATQHPGLVPDHPRHSPSNLILCIKSFST